MMPMAVWLLITAACWAVVVWMCWFFGARWSSRGPGANPITGLLWLSVRVFCHLRHRPTYRGLQHVPDTNRTGGLIVVANHTGPIDPLVIQAACRFEIRWMMAEEMMIDQLDWLWRRQRMIPVARAGSDMAAAREAIRHVRSGGVIGIFPEGGIVRPSGQIRPFHQGVGLVIVKTEAPVLLAWVRGTPEATGMMAALKSRSRPLVDFIDLLEFTGQRDPRGITSRLRSRLSEASGWPQCQEPLTPPRPKSDPFALS